MQLIKYIDKYVGVPACIALYAADSLSRAVGNPVRGGEWEKRKRRIYKERRLLKKQIKGILIIKFWGFGNIILAQPMLRAVRQAFPNAEISFLTLESNRNLLETNSYVDEILTLRVKGLRETASELMQLAGRLRRKRFDLILDLEQFARAATIIAYLSKAKVSIGFDTEGQFRGMLYTIPVKYNNEQHMSRTFCDIALACGIDKCDHALEKIAYTPNDKGFVERFISKYTAKDKKLVGMHISSGDNAPARRWPKEKFARLADILSRRHNCLVVFTGSPSDNALVKDCMRLMKEQAVNAAGCFSLRQLAAFIEHCKIFFSNDTGPLHMASAMNTPTVCFFGPNTPILYGPLADKHIVFYKNLACSPCMTNYNLKTTTCKNPKCMRRITIKEVLAALKEQTFI